MLRKLQIAVLMALCFCFAAGAAATGSAAGSDGLVLNGSDKSPVKIEVYSDFQCPGCLTLYLDTLRPVMQKYKDKVCVVYYEYPLVKHWYAQAAARYVKAAEKLGTQKAKLVFDSIFKYQERWSSDGNLEAAVAQALSREDFLKIKKILKDPAMSQAIDDGIARERERGRGKGISETPTMIISYSGKQQKFAEVPTYQVMQLLLDPLVK